MTEDNLAKRRFLMLTVFRFSGVALAFTGISIVMKRWLEPADIIGTVLIALGAFEVIVLPLILVRAWRSPK